MRPSNRPNLILRSNVFWIQTYSTEVTLQVWCNPHCYGCCSTLCWECVVYAALVNLRNLRLPILRDLRGGFSFLHPLTDQIYPLGRSGPIVIWPSTSRARCGIQEILCLSFVKPFVRGSVAAWRIQFIPFPTKWNSFLYSVWIFNFCLFVN